ncbi:hypothetical protein [Streptomyces tendae]
MQELQAEPRHYDTGHEGLPRGEMADCLLDSAPLVPVDGALAVPAGQGIGIGIGIEVDEAVVHAGTTEWRHPRWGGPPPTSSCTPGPEASCLHGRRATSSRP